MVVAEVVVGALPLSHPLSHTRLTYTHTHSPSVSDASLRHSGYSAVDVIRGGVAEEHHTGGQTVVVMVVVVADTHTHTDVRYGDDVPALWWGSGHVPHPGA